MSVTAPSRPRCTAWYSAVPGKPVGTVWVGLALRGRPAAATLLQLQGDRAAVRQQTVAWALRALNGMLAAA